MINRVILIGRLTKNPEVRFLPSGMQVTSFSIAVSRKFRDKGGNWQEEVSFFDIECFGKLAEKVAQLGKGYQVNIEGSLRQEKWQTPTGEKRSKVKIVANKITLLGKPKNATTNTQNTQNAKAAEVIEEAVEVEEEIAF
jgi:single-strand DNA-binding protein